MFLSTELMQCVTPHDSEPGAVDLEVTLNGVDYTEQGMSHRFLPKASSYSIYPEVGLVSGGLNVKIAGSGLVEIEREGAKITCRWEMPGLDPRDVLVSRASLWSDSTIACMSPPAGESGSAHVTIYVEDVKAVGEGDEDDVAMLFEYQLPATTTNLFPTHGKLSGGTQINIMGEGFIAGSGLICRFHSVPPERSFASTSDGDDVVDVAAEFLSSTEARCVSPALAQLQPRQKNGSTAFHAMVEVLNRNWPPGSYDMKRGLSFWYRPPPKAS